MLHYSIALLATGFLCLATPTSLTKQVAASSGIFNVLSIGVDGLLAVLDPSEKSDMDKRLNAMYIGMKLSYDNFGIVNVQEVCWFSRILARQLDIDAASYREDFNYHATLYKFDKHPFRTKPSDGISGSGLNTLSKYSWVDFSRIEWHLCGNNTCLTPLVFTFMRVRIDEGVYIDVINLDTDRGAEPGDQMARRWTIRLVSDFINLYSEGNAVIVSGNTGSRYTRFDDNIRLFATQNCLTDAWVRATGGSAPAVGADEIACTKGVPPNINCEDEQKVLYRGSPSINLTSLGFHYDTSRFLSPEGKMLTNRNPVRVKFGWDLKPGIRQSDLYGGPHGTWFNDLPLIPSAAKLASITLRGANRLDSLTLNLTSGQTFTHGGCGGTAYTLNLDSNEYISSVKLCWDKKDGHTRNFYAKVITNKSKIIEAGQSTKYCTTAFAPIGYGVVGTYGQDGQEMDQLGFIYAQQ